MAKLWKGFMPVVSRRYTRTARGVRVQYLRRNARKVQHVKLAPIGPKYIQPRLTRAPAIKATKFWESTTQLCATDHANVAGTKRNIKILNLISLGPSLFQRIGNRVFLQSMMLNFTVNAPMPRGPGGASFMGNHPSAAVYGKVQDKITDSTYATGPYPSWTVSLLLVWIPRPRLDVPAISDFIDDDIGSFSFVGPGPNGVVPIDDLYGCRVLLNKQVKVSLRQDVVYQSDPTLGSGPVTVFSIGSGSLVQEKVFVPLNRMTSFSPNTANPAYSNVETGALVFYALCTTTDTASADTMPKIALFTRTAFNDYS